MLPLRNPLAFLAQSTWEQAGERRPRIVLYLGLFVVGQAILLSEPYLFGSLLNKLQADPSPGNARQVVWTFAWLYLGLQAFFWVFHGPARVIERAVAFAVRSHWKSELFRKATRLTLAWHRDHVSGDVIDRVNRASSSLYEFTAGSFMVVNMILRFLGAQALLLWFDPVAGIVVTGTTLFVLAAVMLVDRTMYQQYGSLNRFENNVTSAVQDYLGNIVTVITLRLEGRLLEEVRRRIFKPLEVFRRNIVLNELKWFLTNMMIGVMVAAVLYLYTARTVAAGGVLMAGTLFTMLEYLRRIGDSFFNFTALYSTIVRQAADVRGVDPILEAYDALGPVITRDGPEPPWERITLRGLGFTYPDAAPGQGRLEGIDLELVRGRAIALVGSSGSGKSTLLQLIRGVQQPSSVEVLRDGEPVAEGLVPVQHVSTLLPQDPEIFADTLRFNITFGVEAADEEIAVAARLARFDSVLDRLPRGLETSIAEKGVNLSGGEKQRLALARGLFFAQSAQVLLLDEPTSNVDSENERAIYTEILRSFRDRAVVSSIHKLHLLPLFDMIHVVEGGRIVESGTFEELVTSGGVLAGLWSEYQAMVPAPDEDVAAGAGSRYAAVGAAS